jgi:hypothetical protein
MPAQGKKSVATTESSEKNLKEALVPEARAAAGSTSSRGGAARERTTRPCSSPPAGAAPNTRGAENDDFRGDNDEWIEPYLISSSVFIFTPSSITFMKNILHQPLGTQHAVDEEFVSALCSPPSKIGTL